MGKTKIKYPIPITLTFWLPTAYNTVIEKQSQIEVRGSPLKFQDIREHFIEFLNSNKIFYETYMFLGLGNGSYQIINQNFKMAVPQLLETYGTSLIIIVKSYAFLIKEEIQKELEIINNRVNDIHDIVSSLPTRSEMQLWKKNSSTGQPFTQSSTTCFSLQEQEVDLAVLFSEPIFDQNRKKPVSPPVNFRSQIYRLHTALKNSLKPEIYFKCEIGTKENLKYLIKFSKPKILHIICHGAKEGSLQFEDDSRTVLGNLQRMRTEDITKVLEPIADDLPTLIFVNSCYSEVIGQVLFNIGVKYVVMIDSQDKIQDEAAQIFSQHFYRNIFSGERIGQAYKSAKERVKIKHNSFGCCCRHSAKEKHKEKCRWTSIIIREFGQIEGHKLFHIPSEKCQCELRNLNRHRLQCEWARQSLFQINNDFRIPLQDGTIRYPLKSQLPAYLPNNRSQLIICCCFNFQCRNGQAEAMKYPHSESNKFKMLPDPDKEKTTSIFKIQKSNVRPHIIDNTAPELIEIFERTDSSLIGRQEKLYEFMKKLIELHQSIFIVYGMNGVGRTTFSTKAATYLIERRAYQMYFFIDLYEVKNRYIFRYKFNQITKFNYNGQVRLKQVKNKLIILILDNADDFYLKEKEQFYEQMKNLKSQLPKCKIIITFKTETFGSYDCQLLYSEKFELEPLSNTVATRLLFSKLRHQLDIRIQYNDIYGLVKDKPELKVPKTIQNVVQSFSGFRNKIKVADIQKKINQLGDGDFVNYRLIQENIDYLKAKNQRSYELLMFISQFSSGLSLDDFNILSFYDKQDSFIHLPIRKTWEKDFMFLFQKLAICQNDQTQEIPQQELSLKAAYSLILQVKTQDKLKVLKGESYFVEEVSDNRFVVKRFIRDFLWNKHISNTNYYMKHLFVAYTAVMLQVFLQWQVKHYYIHQGLLQISALSEAGIFSFNRNVLNSSMKMSQSRMTESLLESIKFAKNYNSEVEQMIKENPFVIDYLTKNDPSFFVKSHKRDFLNIYQFKWQDVFKYLEKSKPREDKLFLCYIENIMVYIPTVMMVAKVENSLLKYVLSKSKSLLSQMRPFLLPQKVLRISLKLDLMKLSMEIESLEEENLLPFLDFGKGISIHTINQIDSKVTNQIRDQWNFDSKYLLMYKEFLSTKDIKFWVQKSKVPISDKVKFFVEKMHSWITEDWKGCQPLLLAKKQLLLAEMFSSFLRNSVPYSKFQTFLIFRKEQLDRMVIFAQQSIPVFQKHGLIKLYLQAKVTAIYLTWQKISHKSTKEALSTEVYNELNKWQSQLNQTEKIFNNKTYNLFGHTELSQLIKQLKQQIKDRLWYEAQTTLVFLKPVCLSSSGKPMLENIIRRKNTYVKDLQRFLNNEFDLCCKYLILNKKKLRQETTAGCSIMLISTDILVNQKNEIFMAFEGEAMEEDLVKINQEFLTAYDFSKIQILFLAGKNAKQGLQKLYDSLSDPPIMISLTPKKAYTTFLLDQNSEMQKQLQPKFLEFQQVSEEKIAYLKELMSGLLEKGVNKKQEVVDLEKRARKKLMGFWEAYILYEKRKKPIHIQVKKGTYKDVSPKGSGKHNINIKLQRKGSIVLRKWKEITQIMFELKKKVGREAVYINIYGEDKNGKTSFVTELARLLVERDVYEKGVYYINGGQISQQKQGHDIQDFMNSMAETSRIINYKTFEEIADSNMLLIIDDYHKIKVKPNGRHNLFREKIKEKGVHLILVTHDQFKKSNEFAPVIPFKLQKLSFSELSLIGYNLLDLKDVRMMKDFQKLKQQHPDQLSVRSILHLKEKAEKEKTLDFDFIEFQENSELKKIYSKC